MLAYIARRTAFAVFLVFAVSSAALVLAAMCGDTAAKLVLEASDALLRSIECRSKRNALRCTLCDDGRMWRDEPPHALIVLLPLGVDVPRAAVGLAICMDCTEAHADGALALAAVEKLRSAAMPDLRVLPPMMAEAGHA